MKKILIIALTLITISFAQFRENNLFKPGVKDGLVNSDPNFLFGLFNSNNFSMNHSYSLSFSSFGSNGLALGVYTNSMLFKLTDNMNFQVDASLVHSPYNSFGKDFQNNLNGFYISRAQFNYKPYENFSLSIQYRNMPGYNSPYGYDDYYNRFPFGTNLFDR